MELSKVMGDLEIKDYSKVTDRRVEQAIKDLGDILSSKPSFDSNDVRALSKLLDCAKDGKFRELLKWRDDGYQEYIYLMNYQEPVGSARSITSNRQPEPQQNRIESRYSDRRDFANQQLDTDRQQSRQSNPFQYPHEDRQMFSPQQAFRGEKSPLLVENSSGNTGPTTLAQHYSDLYNKEWGDAMRAMMNHSRDEENNVKDLSKVLIMAYNFCDDIANKHRQSLHQLLLHPLGLKTSVGASISNEMHTKVYKAAKHIQEDTGYCSMPAVTQIFMENEFGNLQFKLPREPAIRQYAEKCVEVCWLLNIHDPPLSLVEEKENNPIQDHLKLYTKPGNKVLYNVWPTLLLKDKGPVLTKGIVQAY